MASGYWSKEETLKLISICSDDTVQAQLEGCRRNSDVYRKIAKELTEAGYTRTLEQCRDKMKKLKAEYKKVKDKRNETGQGRYPDWDFFDPMDNVLGHKPATQPPVVVDSGNQSDDLQSQRSPEIIENPSSNRSVSTSDDGVASSSVSTDSQSNQSNLLAQATATSKLTSKKRKRSKFDVAGELIDKLIGMQEKSERMMLDLEEKRTRLEEKQLELDANLRREERDFQFKMMSMMMRNVNSVSPAPVPHYSMHPGYPYSHSFDAQGTSTSFDGSDHNSSFDPDATQEGL